MENIGFAIPDGRTQFAPTLTAASQSPLSFGAEQTLRTPTPLRILKIRTAASHKKPPCFIVARRCLLNAPFGKPPPFCLSPTGKKTPLVASGDLKKRFSVGEADGEITTTALRNPLRDRQAPLNPKQTLNQLYYLFFRFQFEVIDFAPLRSVKKRINRFIVQ